MVSAMLRTNTLLKGLLDKNPGSLSMEELDSLQQFINKGRSIMLLEQHPQLEGIFAMHAINQLQKNDVVDILLCFMEEGGTVGSQQFTKMVEGMIAKNLVSTAIVNSLTKNRFMLPGPVPNLNADGVTVKA
jgi:hypothetical protein